MQYSLSTATGIDPAPFWANLFLYSHEEEYISTLFSLENPQLDYFHSPKRFTDHLNLINDGDKSRKSFIEI